MNILIIKEPKDCKLGQGEDCCAFLVLAPTGFECSKNTSSGNYIRRRLEAGTMVAKGTGDWDDCPLKGK